MEWRPHPRQTEALRYGSVFELLFGGARGGGKTDAGLVWLTNGIEIPGYRALVIRKNSTDLSDWSDRAIKFYKGLGANIIGRPITVIFPSGAKIETGHLKDDQAYTKYQGQEYQRILIEELTQIPDEKRYLQLIASCRSTIKDLKAQVFNTTNPGGAGHVWVKKRWQIDKYPRGGVIIQDEISGRKRIFIPSLITDNPTLVENDPDYVKSLDALRSTDVELWKAWRMGDWDTFAGQYFQEWAPQLHVVPSFSPKDNTTIIGGMDWGRTDAFAFYLDVVEKVVGDDFDDFYRTRTFFEAYGTNRSPKDWSQYIKKKLEIYKVSLDDIAWVRCDNQIFNVGNDSSKSIYDQFCDEDERWRGKLLAASKDRIGGWEVLHNWLSIAPDGLPYWQIAANCTNFIDTFPSLIHDENRVEDVDTDGEDHAADAQRYMKKHLKWIDARVGMVSTNKTKAVKFKAFDAHGNERSIDLDKFAGVNKSSVVVNKKV